MTLYNDDVFYNADLPYNGQEAEVVGVGGAGNLGGAGGFGVARRHQLEKVVRAKETRDVNILRQTSFIASPTISPMSPIGVKKPPEGFEELEEDDFALVMALLELTEDF
jgi:hypothetical protein